MEKISGTRPKAEYRSRSRKICALLMLLLPACFAAVAHAQNLPVYTSPIDITGFKVELHVAAPDRNTGRPVDIALPTGLLGPKMGRFFNVPLSTQIDEFWSSTPDPKTGKTQRDLACTGPQGIIVQVQKAVTKVGSGFSAYDISCNLSSSGKLLVKQVGSTLYLGYLLTANKVTFTTTTPYTCHAGRGTPACPNDPRFTVTFASEITTVVRTPDLCHLTAEGAAVNTQAVNIDNAGGLTGALAKLSDDLFLGHKFSAAERAIEATEVQMPLPLDNTFKEMRDSPACTGRDPVLRRTMTAFRDFETVIQRQIIFRMSHVGIGAPTLSAPNPGAPASAHSSGTPSFTRPMISTSQPAVAAGATVQVRGQYFPANLNLTTAIPVTIAHGGYGPNSTILGGLCFGTGGTELQWGPAGAQPRTERLPGNAQGACAGSYEAGNLAPGTAYQFRARDCDVITCSPWSQSLQVRTGVADPEKGKVLLTIDGNGSPAGRGVGFGRVAAVRGAALSSSIGSAMTNAQGTFETTATIPSNLSPGPHTLRATSGSATAEVSITVNGAGGGRASIMMVGLLRGETGCPNHPISSTQTGTSFMLFGTGFAPGPVSIHLDAPNSPAIGAATARPDGSFCQQMPGVSGRLAGAHKLMGVQNGVAQAQMPITFVAPSVVR